MKALNCYFAMPFRKSARITATNESTARVDAFYSNIDYQIVPALPDEVLYFHAQYRQADAEPAHHQRLADQRRRRQAEKPRRQEKLCLRRNARTRPLDGGHARAFCRIRTTGWAKATK